MLAAVLAVLPGCALPQKVGLTPQGAPRYERVEIVYRRQTLPSELFENPQAILQADAESHTTPTNQLDGWASAPANACSRRTARLWIQYPHPDGRAGWARATLRLCYQTAQPETLPETISQRVRDRLQRAGWSWNHSTSPHSDGRDTGTAAQRGPQPRDEVWVLDIPKEELDLLLIELANQGLFDEQLRPQGGAHFDVQIDRGRLVKDWTPEPRLDDLLERIYREGRLGGFVEQASFEQPVSSAEGAPSGWNGQPVVSFGRRWSKWLKRRHRTNDATQRQ